jgi:NADH-quinone oxidoreductase subunit M
MLWMVKRVFWGPVNEAEGSGTSHLHDDLNSREIAVLVPIVVLIIWMGVHPQTFLSQPEGTLTRALVQAQAPAPRAYAAVPGQVHEQAHEAAHGHAAEEK